ncbi:MAG: hypothetical protein CSB44_01535 [Gammaproteobacteria bacterium]|nr:MAG: hypothetical protein CSB44_01535 [Gammaproteobacteria bacterium]
MKFTKTAVAVAVAGLAAAPMIASADTVLSGDVQIMLEGSDADGDEADPTITADDVRFGINASHTLNSGLTGYGNLRWDINSLSNSETNPPDSDDSTKGRNYADEVYVGIKGGFGDLRFGEVPLAVEYGQLANDIYDIGDEVNGGMSYEGTFGPIGLLANFSPDNNRGQLGVGAKFNMAGFGFGIGYETRELANSAIDRDYQTLAVGASYGIAGFDLAAHYYTREIDDIDDTGEGFAVQAGYGIGDFSGTITYAHNEGEDGFVTAAGAAGQEWDADNDIIRLDLAYDLGGNMEVSTRIENNDDADETAWRLKLAKGF